MKKLIIALSLVLVSSCLYADRSVKGNGKVVKQEYITSSFKGIDAGSIFQLIVSTDEKCSVRIETDENLMDLVSLNVSNSILNLRLKENIRSYSAMNVYISLPQLEKLKLSGAAKAEFTEKMQTNGKMTIDLSGASNIENADFQANTVSIDLSGASRAEANVKANKLNLDASGTSFLRIGAEVDELRIENSGVSKSSINVAANGGAELSASGSSHITGRLVANNLRAETSGAASLKLSGKWEHQRLSANGASNIDLSEAVSYTTDVTASGSSQVAAGHTSISKFSRNGNSSIKSLPSKTDSKKSTKISDSSSSEKISSDSISLKLQQIAAEFAELAKKLGDKAANATVNINGKNYLLKDVKISVVNNSDGSVSLFMNGEEAYRLKK
ncbi:MAG: DUF2807 domain-containing protein [Prevotellaceae bacterium]|jgi:hypothetical protein|nr:DUF2807 domain-containing protein [Prevotellaceae bacterium]